MNDNTDFDRFVADQFAQVGRVAAPEHSVDQILIKARRMRPLPRWLATIKEPPMRISSRVAVGSPLARVAAIVIVLMILTALTAGSVAVGATLLASPAGACLSGPGAFVPGPTFVAPRFHAAGARLSDGRVLVTSFDVPSAEIYDPGADAFRSAGVLAEAGGLAPVALPDDRVLVIHERSTSPAEVWDPRSQTFSPSGSPLIARGDGTPSLLPDGRVLVVGGSDGEGTAPVLEAETWAPSTELFSTEPTLAGLAPDTATVLDDGRVLLVGDLTRWWEHRYTEASAAPSAVIWDPVSGTLDDVGDPSVWRVWARAIRLVDGKVLIVGGMDWTGKVIAEAELYDPVTRAFTPAGELSDGRIWHAAEVLSDGRVLMVGGVANENYEKVLISEVWDPDTLTFVQDAALVQGRMGWTGNATLLADCSVLIVGGTILPDDNAPVMRWVPGA